MKPTLSTRMRHSLYLTMAACTGALFAGVAIAQVSIANSPLSVSTSVDPNILFIIDDSGSMHYEVMPDDEFRFGSFAASTRFVFPRVSNVYGSGDYNSNVVTVDDHVFNRRGRSPQINKSYYDPSITYTPWVKHDGTLYPNAVPTAAYHNPEKTARGYRNLTVSNSNTDTGGLVNSTLNSWRTCDGPTAAECSSDTSTKSFWPATYFWYTEGDAWTLSSYDGPFEIRDSIPNYSGHGRDSRTDCEGGVCSYAQEIQNFANWYTYYRSRILASRAGIGRAFAQQGTTMRVGFGAINKGSATIDGVSTGTIIKGVRPFSGSNREEFFNLLYQSDIPDAATPLRRALDDAGQYFSRSDNSGPWAATPGTSDAAPHLECRQSYTILMTDGYWNGDPAGTAAARADNDSADGSEIEGPGGSPTYTYSARTPFSDNRADTLADVAMYYWKRDLRTNLDNRVPTSITNPAFWQHMVTFGVGLGVSGTIDPDEAFSAIDPDSGITIDWPAPSVTGTTENIDDLLHAAVNSRGGFFSAADPETFADELSNVLHNIVSRTSGYGTSAAASSAVLQSETLLYTAGFRSTDWSGTLRAEKPRPPGSPNWTGATCSAPYSITSVETSSGPVTKCIRWDAETTLAALSPSARKIFTRNTASNTVVELEYANLSTEQQAALDRDLSNSTDDLGLARISWLRGQNPAHPSFRNRMAPGDGLRLLGDIVNSNPQFVSRMNFGYDRFSGTEGSSYITFRSSSAYKSRPDMIYVGANDGMLHAFDAQTGVERFAYMPSELLLGTTAAGHARVNKLMDPNYDHDYFVDGTPAVGDAYLGGSWKTVLVGTMGAGGRTVFALDVTNPSAISVLWEFTHEELGYRVTQPQIARMRNGNWVAIFGNGYNSSSHTAKLFIVRLSDGQLVGSSHPVDTGVGSTTSPNGLAPAVVTDWPAYDLTAQTIFAGDLHGNLWRFDVSGNSTSNWSNASNRKIVFTARDSANVAQPITSTPQVALNEQNPDSLWVLFGTGSFFRPADSSSLQVQSIYGLIDTNTAIAGRSALQQQTILKEQTAAASGGTAFILREVSANELEAGKRGWFLDLIFAGVAKGERVVNQPTFPSGPIQERIRVSTLIPNNDPCDPAVSGFLMDIDLRTGGRFKSAVFDLNADGAFDDGDAPAGWDEDASGIGGPAGETITYIRTADTDVEILCTGEGCEEMPGGLGGAGAAGRQSWRQIR